MASRLVAELAARLMVRPAVPYHEHAVAAEVENISRDYGLDCRSDSFGNILVSLQTWRKQRLVVLSAHMDHPGFRVLRRIGPSRFLAEFLGGVPDNYFRPGTRLRVFPGSLAARLGKRVGKKRQFEIVLDKAGVPARYAVWELDDVAIRNGRIYGRSCDDLVGVASALATLVELKRRRARVNVAAAITRAEEIGFQGALGLIARKTIPRSALVVSLETSRELPPIKMKRGVIIRVGDRSSVFDPEATRFLCEIANDLAKRDKHFKFQRALMSGGTCEATAYQELGYQTCAVCIALGNYHNCGEGGRIRAEYVSMTDAESMVCILSEAARRIAEFSKLVGRLPSRLRVLAAQGIRELSRK